MSEVSPESRRRPGLWAFVGLAFALIFPSTAIFKKIGLLPLWGYVAGAVVALLVAARWIVPWLRARMSKPLALALALLMFAGLASAYFTIHPRIDTAGFRLFGLSFGSSDADDALDVGLQSLMAGRYPYYTKTFLDQPLTPMPGALLMALPFYLLGDSAAQNLFWLAVLLMLLVRHTRDLTLATLVFGVALLCSPNITYHVLQGCDYTANGLYVLTFLLLLTTSARDASRGAWMWVWAALLGVAFSSRPNFIVIGPLVALELWRVAGLRRAVGLLSVTGVAFLGVTLPFLLHDPAGFSPLHTAGKLNPGGQYPWAPIAIPMAGAVVATALGCWRGGRGASALMANVFVVQALMIVSGFALVSVVAGRANLEYPHFGMLFLFFGVFAFGPAVFRGTPGAASD